LQEALRETTVNTINQFAAIEAIKTLKAKYFRFLDMKDWERYMMVYTKDAVFDASVTLRAFGVTDETILSNAVFHGREKIRDFAKSTVGEVITVHHGHTPEIELTSQHTAKGIWALEDLLWWPEGVVTTMQTKDGEPIRRIHGFGHYHDLYELVDGQWLISKVAISRLHMQTFTAL
jgi:hypothetical protein